MDAVVHGDEPPTEADVLSEAVPGVHLEGRTTKWLANDRTWKTLKKSTDQSENVVEPVEEDEPLLAQHNEDRVAEFEDLRQCKEPHPVLGAAVGAGDADGVVKAAQHQRLVHLPQHVVAAGGAEDGQADVPQRQRPAQLEGRPRAHQLLQRVDQHHVDDAHVGGVVPIGLHPLQRGIQRPVEDGEGRLALLVHQRRVAAGHVWWIDGGGKKEEDWRSKEGGGGGGGRVGGKGKKVKKEKCSWW